VLELVASSGRRFEVYGVASKVRVLAAPGYYVVSWIFLTLSVAGP
ncbi:uncharacterized protein METZ01_LOCUS444924, partial [marine metagenome]